MKLFRRDSIEDLILRGWKYKGISELFGFKPEGFKKAIKSVRNISQNEYCSLFVRKHFTNDYIEGEILEWSKDLSKDTADLLNVFGIKQSRMHDKSDTPSALKIFPKKFQKLIENSINEKKIKNKNSTMIRKYGDFSPIRIDEFRKKMEDTNLERYGSTCCLGSDKVREKSQKTLLENYGVIYPLQSKAIQEKAKKTNIKKYGVENVLQLDEIRKRAQETCLNKYGETSPMKTNEVKEKVANTMMERYGAYSFMKTDEFREMSKRTNLEKYGVEYPAQNPEIFDKVKKTNLEKYGSNSFLETKEFREKSISTNLERYGVENPMLSPEIVAKGIRTKAKNNTFNSSVPEDNLETYLTDIYPIVRRNYNEDDRYPFACDFYIPERDLFIELNAHWTHQPLYGWYNSKSTKHRNLKSEMEEKFPDWCPMSWWTSDILKKETARKNNLNYVVLWNEQDIKEWFKLGCPDGHDGDGMYTWKKDKWVD